MSSFETDRWYTPQNQVMHVIDAHFNRLDMLELPRCYRPTSAGLLVATELISLEKEDGHIVRFVNGEKNLGRVNRPDLPKHGLLAVIGPEALPDMTGDTRDGSSMLWDRGTVEDSLRYGGAGEGLREAIEDMYQIQ